MSVITASALFFCLIVAALAALYLALYGSHRALRERYFEHALKLQIESGHVLNSDRERWTRKLLQWAIAKMPEQKNATAVRKTARTLMQAGFGRAGGIAVFRVVRLAATAGCAGLAALIAFMIGFSAPKTLLMALAGASLGAVGPSYYISKRARGRQGRIARQLSDVLDLLVVCVEAGLGLFEAIKVVGEETAHQGQDVGQELMTVSGEVSAGATLGQALRNLGDRTAVEDVRPLAATLIQSEQLGAQIGPALRSSSDMLRTKRRLRAEEAAQKSTIKILFPLVLFILPAMLIVILAPALIGAMRTLSQ